jgi:DNA-directed RNA polymerase subunit RPC12/RpoP
MSTGPIPSMPAAHGPGGGRGGQHSFVCARCGFDVPVRAAGTAHRNHCPACLWSRHLDGDRPGDRSSGCRSPMEPIAISVRGAGEWVVVHRCAGCGALRLNRTAGDDNALVLLRLAVEPLARPPFPIERVALLPAGAAAPADSMERPGR